MARIDHLLWACSDLDKGIATIEALTGVRAVYGGEHKGRGTRNALLSLGNKQYLELLAPDPAQDLEGVLGGSLRELQKDGLLTFCIEEEGLESLAGKVRKCGLSPDGPNDWSRKTPDGGVLNWRLLMIRGHHFGGLVPFVIDWKECAHPSGASPAGCSLLQLEVETAESDNVEKIYAALGLSISVKPGSDASLSARIMTKNGEVRLEPAISNEAIII